MIRAVLVEVCAGCGWLPCLCKCKWPAQHELIAQVHQMRQIAAAAAGDPIPSDIPARFSRQIWPVKSPA